MPYTFISHWMIHWDKFSVIGIKYIDMHQNPYNKKENIGKGQQVSHSRCIWFIHIPSGWSTLPGLSSWDGPIIYMIIAALFHTLSTGHKGKGFTGRVIVVKRDLLLYCQSVNILILNFSKCSLVLSVSSHL